MLLNLVKSETLTTNKNDRQSSLEIEEHCRSDPELYVIFLLKMLTFGQKYAKPDAAAQTPIENSMHKFVEDFSREVSDTKFPTIDLTTSKFNNNAKCPNASTSKCSNLSLNASRKRSGGSPTNMEHLNKIPKEATRAKGQFTYLPMLNENRALTKSEVNTTAFSNKQEDNKRHEIRSTEKSTPKLDIYRNLTLITGDIKFVIKANKTHSNSNFLFEIFAKILRISTGKFSCEKVFLLRNDSGPVLQAAWYEIDTAMPNLSVGMNVRCVGKFKGSSRFHLYKIKQEDCLHREESLIRLKNLCNFTMNKMNNRNI